MKKERSVKQILQAQWCFNRRSIRAVQALAGKMYYYGLITETERRTVCHIFNQAGQRNDKTYEVKKSELP